VCFLLFIGFDLCRGLAASEAAARGRASLWAFSCVSPFTFRLRVFGVQQFCRDADVGFPVSNGKLLTITIAALKGHLRNGLPADHLAATSF